ncbi:non-ribosomal peptide synthetase, partial [Myxococcus sp. CA040A]|uniref:non-ribosomal peptide synthetase n=1 Tax=Myxococcus sp. CA040A TaxID=2741738 RepID=UPI00157B9425
ISTLHFVPSMLRAFLEEPGLEKLSGLRRVVCSGEALSSELVARAHSRLPASAEVHNLYGPTEAAVDVSFFHCARGSSRSSVPIGRPVANTRLYVLDSLGQPTPIGVPGELFIGGVQVGLGYWRKPQLTAERFIPDAFSDATEARLYRTGDVARWLPDGTLEYLGRSDFQVKLRGFRIELGDIEAALLSHPSVRDAVVLVREDSPGDQRLVAYVTGDAEPLTAELLKTHLQPRLPEYMVPSAFTHLGVLPLSPSGKVDRKALPAPDAPVAQPGRYVAPRTPLEETLATLFAQVLGIERIGIHDGFFEMGGHSLLATQVVVRVRGALGLELPLRTLFEAPTVAALAARLDARSQGTSPSGEQPPLVRVDRTGRLPLSFAQQRLWFLDQLQPGMALYNMPVALRLSGRLEHTAFQQAVDELVRRHESLRTTFRVVEGEPHQVIHPALPGNLRVVDLSGRSAEQRAEETTRLAMEDASRPFDLASGPLMRTTLLVLEPNERVLLLCMHHTISDGWSQTVLVRELVQLYESFRQGLPSPLPELPIQYADYSLWQRDWLQGATLQTQLDWWKGRLSGAPGMLDLLTDKPRPAVLSHQGASIPLSLSPALSNALEALAQRERVTPFMLLLAGFQTLLHRYSGQDDILIGSPIAGRHHARTEGLIGFFVNTLVLRARFAPDLTFRGLLAQVRDMTLGAYEHQDIPFERLVEELQPTRDLSRTPLFQALFALQNMPTAEMALPELTLRSVDVEHTASRFELELALTRTTEGYSGILSFNTELFERSTAERFVAHLLRLLEAAVAEADAPLSALSLMTEAERQRVLVEWNDTRADYPSEATLPLLFSEQVRRTPEDIALQFEGQHLTYAELDARSNQLARHLLSLGLGQEPRLAVCIPRSLELYVALLGILKAGGCYVPLDASHPSRRIAFMLEDSNVAGVLTVSAVQGVLPSGEWPVVVLDTDSPLIASRSSEPISVPLCSDNLAYVTYTSGSTGTPKGVAITHRGVLRLIFGAGFASRDPGEVILQVIPLTFDPSAQEIWSALLSGARLAVYPPGTPEVTELARVIDEHHVTTAQLASALFDVMQRHEPEALSRLPRLWVGGDVLPVPTARERLARGLSLTNVYGPTEATVVTTLQVLSPGEPLGDSIPIGRPIPNTQVYVLDASLRPVPVGVPGELFIGGPGLARGYQGRPALTAERFVPHPFSTTPGERLYRTGDRVCWTQDGVLRFLGRIDLQVKLRGFRIELGEIESSLRAHPEVREVAVVIREDVPGDKRLVAYVATTDGNAPSGEDPKAWLRQRLPEYMVPAHVMYLSTLPQTTHGKVDRKALPVPETSVTTTPEDAAPRSPLEAQLATIWAEVLHRDTVGRHDNFFELGGHSLMATQVVSRIRAALGVELPLARLFSAPTVAELAAKLGSATKVKAPALTRVPRTDDLPLSFAQQRLWFIDQLEPGSTLYNSPLPLRLEGTLDERALRQTFDELVRRHESLRTTFRSEAGQPVQKISPATVVPMQKVDLSDMDPEDLRTAEANRLVNEEARRPFDLARGPLLRTLLLKLRPQEHILVLHVHHIVSDGWSLGVFVREMTALYEAFRRGLPSPLPELSIQYADYAVWQRSWLRDDTLTEQVGWWKQQLEGAPFALDMPTDKVRPAVFSHRGALVDVRLPLNLSQAVEALAHKEGASPFMVLLAAFQTLLHRYSGQDDILVGSPIANRNLGDTEGLIGFFVNTLVLRARFGPKQGFRELLAQLRDRTLGAYEYQGVPFEKMVEELQPRRDASRTPLFQAMFTLQNAPLPEIVLPELSVSPADLDETGLALVELGLDLTRTPEGFNGAFSYSTDLYEPATLERFSLHFLMLLRAIVAQPETPLSELPLLSPEERQQLLLEWTGEREELPADARIHALIEAQVARTPDAVAVVSGEDSVTYRELEARATRLARRLRELGVGLETRVAVCMERSVELLVSLLGVLKAGGAYVPLDPEYPAERLAFMLEDSGARVVVSRGPAREKLGDLAGRDWLDVDTVPREGDVAALTVDVPPEAAAYVLYTSGSTGRPKGVVVQHRSLVNFTRAAWKTYPVEPGDRMLQFASISWDTSAEEIYPCLTRGGTLVLRTPDMLDAPAVFLAKCEAAGVTQLNLPTAFWHEITASLEEGRARLPKQLKWVVIGGERAAPERLAAWRRGAGTAIPLRNTYGLTEVTAVATAVDLMAVSNDEGAREVPIGRPLTNVTTYVLDSAFEPTPTGVVGELYIGGEGVARGYLGRADLTADRFTPNPFGQGERLYRTGDKARWKRDGGLEYLGRGDTQVKLRGVRIELGEIEAALRAVPEVRDAVAQVREDVPGDKRLVAYVVPSGATQDAVPELDVLALHDQLQRRLPAYMMPAAFVPLAVLPLTPNGKVDRKALPAPDANLHRVTRAHEPPATPMEERLAELWRELLRVPTVGRRDNFFELGGHSLMATRLVARVRDEFSVELGLRAFFEAPTLAGLAERLTSATSSSSLPELGRRRGQGPVPLSFAQQRLWFLDQLQPGTSLYNMPVALRLSGRLEHTAFERAVDELVRRHESLRTTFLAVEGEPHQVIHPALPGNLRVVDLTSRSAEQRAEETTRLAMEDASLPFDLASGPLMRTTLVVLEPNEHVLLLCMHHTISDGWSQAVLVRELVQLYESFRQGLPSPLPELPIQYADYSLWQRDWLQGATLQTQLDWWKGRLSGAPGMLDLLTDKPRPAVLSHQGASVPLSLSPALSNALEALAQRERVTPFMLLLAGFQTLLHRYSGQDDILIGSPIAGRHHARTEGLIGFFVNTLVLRARFAPDLTFRSLLAQVRDMTLGAYEHQDIPFERLVEELQPTRDLSRTPLFQALFALQNTPDAEMALPELMLRSVDVEYTVSRFELELALTRTTEGYSGGLAFKTDLFERSTIERLGAHLLRLLEAAVADADAPLSTLSLMTEIERQRVLVEWNDTRADYPSEATLPLLFSEQVRRTPEAIALQFEGQHLTYAELDARSNQLARHLLSLGLGQEPRLAVCIPRSLELYVALLGILKAGGCYVPLDASHPSRRIAFMLEDSSVAGVLTVSSVQGVLPSGAWPVVALDTDEVRIATQSEAPLSVPLCSDNLAYVTYTSGSTGTPKGVAITHRGVLRLIAGMGVSSREPGEVILQVTPLTFDPSALEIWSALLTGARLAVYPPGTPEVTELARVIDQHQVTSAVLATALFDVMQRHEPEALSRLPRLLVGGDVLPVPTARERLARRLALINAYGPTEATVAATLQVLSPGMPLGDSIPIGRPIPNTQVYVLDASLRPVPVGVPGELFIGGPGLARGYQGRPALTAERFVPHPFATTPGERLYRTGDRVCWTQDGVLRFLGRIDLQVKLRGFRIELGEIESSLRAHPEVREVAVVIREDVPGDKRLVAYVATTDGNAPTSEDPKAWLRQRLPEYMVPAHVMYLSALPQTTHGKVDRKALPVPDASGFDTGSPHEPPATPMEERLAELWRELLRVPTVGRHDSFFELGGHSLMATRLVARIRDEFSVELGLRAFFESPTLAGIAERLTSATSSSSLPELGKPRGQGTVPLSFAQQRLWFLDQLQPGTSVYNIPVALRLSGRLEPTAFQQAVDELVRRHASLRTTFRAVEGEPHQVIHPALPGNLRMVDLTSRSAEQRAEETTRLAMEDASLPFDLASGPLMRTTLLVLEPNEHVLLLCMHHAISDGWSQTVLVRELVQLYEAFRQGLPSPLPELPIQYADYSLWQRDWLQGETLQTQLDWWKGRLSGAAGTLDLLTDKARPAVLSHQGASIPLSLSPALSNALEALAQRERVTPFMLLLAGFQTLLHRYSGQDDILIGSPIAGRHHARTEGLIGFFVNTLVLRARFTPDLTFRGLLAQVRDMTLGAYEHQDIPFERLVEELQPTRDLSRTPLFQALFALQNTPDAEVALPELTLRSVDVEHAVSRFELELALTRTPEGYSGGLAFKKELFEHSTIERLGAHLLRLLEAAVAEADAPLSALSLMTEAERRRVLVEWNDTRADYPSEATLPQQFSEQVRRTPEAIAIQFEGQHLTYAELDARSNQLARHLLSLGLGQEPRLAICIPRSLELYVALLGILKAGGCYVPLDASHPSRRIAFMLEDSSVAGVLTVSAVQGVIPSGPWPVVVLATDSPLIESQSAEPLSVPLASDSLAYVTYTSGSTGTPKGVAITHRGVLRLVSGMGFASREPGEVILQVAPLTFDPTALEIWSALLTGARLAVYPPVTPEVTELARVIDEHHVTTALLATALFDVMQQHEPEALSRLPRLWVGGDVLPVPRARERLARGLALTNAYGPTEVTVVTTQQSLPPGEPLGDSVPIGRPIPNTQVYVLDASLRPVPVGVPGELFIGGPGLARGYQGRPALTAERFVPHPFATTPGERLYRTGDRVCWTQDGALRFLGRIDLQVKVRGFRIELGEVESALRAHPEVREVAVVVREDVPGDKRLVAYVVTADGKALTGEEPRAWLRQRLPEYMVPTHVMYLSALPQTTHGKVDRKALPVPDASGFDMGRAHEPPATPFESRLAELWTELLQVPRVGRHDSFFELGGHSLMATRLVARIRAELGLELGVRTLFESPTLAGLAEHLQRGLSMERGLAVLPPLVPVPRGGALPLSFAQQRLWFLDQLQPGQAHYNIPWALKLLGTVNLTSLQRAFDALVQRHESLRTTFTMEGGEPRQVIHATATPPFNAVDLTKLPPEQREAEVLRLSTEDALRPFDLAAGPLLRVTVLHVTPTEHVLLVCMHHIVSDGWSMGVLVRELTQLYEAFQRGAPSPLPELPVQYADYAVWQRGWLKGEALSEQLGWWKRHLDGAAPALELPTDKPRPAALSSHGGLASLRLSPALSDAVDAATRREKVTPFMLLLAAFQALLQRYSGQDDVVVGSPIAGRRHAQTEGMLGVFINTLALRARFTPELTFRGLLAQVRDTTLGAYEHQDLPFERLVEELQPARDLGRTPLFQAMFVLQNAPTPEVALSDLTLKSVDVEHSSTKFELNLHMVRATDGYRGGLVFSTDLFEPATAERLMHHFQHLLERALATPDAPLATLSLLTDDERKRLLLDAPPVEASVQPGHPFHRLFEQQAARTPEAPALRCEDQAWSYRQLDQRANQLAHHLRALGAGPDVPVALCLERGVEVVAALLAVHKAAAAYVPLEPSQPAARLRGLVEEVSAPIVITEARLAGAFDGLDVRCVRMDEDAALLANQPVHATGVEVGLEHLAYVLFTSGSTGRPKGVAVPHGQLMSYVHAAIDRLRLTECSSFAMVSTFAADLGNTVLFPALVTGGLLHVLTQERARSPEGVAEYFQRHAVDCVKIVPSHLAALLTVPEPRRVLPRKRLVTGGESSSWALLEKVHALAPECEVFNHYGPTETTVGVLAGRVELPPGDKAPAQVPLGRALGQTRLYVLDAGLRPVPVGMPGELYVGGPQVARGYFGRPELTAERFLADPFSTASEARMYRTGDRVRWLADGRMEFIGRMDFQVKVRGFRVEPGEIAAVLREHASLRDAVVVTRDDGAGDKRLVAYIVASTPPAPDVATLRTWLQQRLPEYMVPSAFVALPALPLTLNGKVDTRALPEPSVDASGTESALPPRTPLELRLVRIWEEVLGVRAVGVRANFFELGGHSLMAVRLMAEVSEAVGRPVPLAALFQAPTVEQLAVLLSDNAPLTPSTVVPFGAPRPGGKTPFFCVHPVGGNVLAYAELARRLGAERPFIGLQARGVNGEAAPRGTVEEMAQAYVTAMREVQPSGPYLLGGWSLGGVIAYEMTQQLRAQGEQVELLALIDSYAPDVTRAQEPSELDRLQVVGMFARDLLGASLTNLALDFGALASLEPDAVLEHLLAAGTQAGVLPPGTDPEQLKSLLRVFEANLGAARRYVAKPLSTRAVLFKATEHDAELPTDGGWSALIGEGLERHPVKGDHYGLLREPGVQTLAERLRDALKSSR